MNFIVGQTGSIYDSITSVIIQDGDDTVSNIQLPSQEDTIAGWHALLTLLHNTNPDELNDLLAAIPQLLETHVDEEAHSTYLHMLRALFKWLEEIQLQTLNTSELQALNKLYKQLECALFHFQVDTPNSEFYEAVFSQPGEELWRIIIPSDRFDKTPVEVSQVALKLACERYSEQIEQFIDDYVYFQAHVVKDDPKTFNVFICLSKALIKLIKQETARLGMYISHVPDICTFIVKNEPDSDEQKVYLEPILNSHEHIEQRLERLDGIIRDIKNEISQKQAEKQFYPKQQKEDGHRRLMHVTSLISEHYLRLYDLDHSVTFWEKTESKDPVLHFFLTLHRRPYLFVSIQLLLFCVLSFFAYQHWNIPRYFPSFNLLDWHYIVALFQYIPLLFLLLWYLPALFLVAAILLETLRKSKSKSQRWFLYSPLWLPRILGASIVGIIFLFLNNQSWLIGIQSSPITWLLLVLFAYSASFLYIYREVHNTTKFLQDRSGPDIFSTSMKIFLIALAETLFIVIFMSTLIFPVVRSSLGYLSGDMFGIYVTIPWLSIGFFPPLILLWTGFALFIGAFVQLLWQGQGITEPI